MSLTTLLNLFLAFKYPALIVVAFFEGPIAMTMSGVLLKLGYADFVPLYASLMIGDLLADCMWYAIGRRYAHPFVRRFGKYFGITEALLGKTENLYRTYHGTILFVSKITMGLGFAIVVLMTAGMLKISLKKYLALNALGQCIWTALLMSIGYFFGGFYLTLNKDFQIISLVAFAVLVGSVLFGVSRYMKNKNLYGSL